MGQGLTCLFDLRLPRLGGGYELGGGLRDAPGRLLQALQVPAVFVCFDLDGKQNLLVYSRGLLVYSRGVKL